MGIWFRRVFGDMFFFFLGRSGCFRGSDVGVRVGLRVFLEDWVCRVVGCFEVIFCVFL